MKSAEDLEEYLHSALRTAALTDGVAALYAHRAAHNRNIAAIVDADWKLYHTKLWAESRAMSVRLGERLLSLARHTLVSELLDHFASAKEQGRCRATHAVVMAVVLAEAEVDEQGLWAAQMSGVANMVLGASLRTMRLTHIDTQRILHRAVPLIDSLYAEVLEMRLEDMQSFAPVMDIVAALHEQGNERLFMN